jgi:hypothetical protein
MPSLSGRALDKALASEAPRSRLRCYICNAWEADLRRSAPPSLMLHNNRNRRNLSFRWKVNVRDSNIRTYVSLNY